MNVKSTEDRVKDLESWAFQTGRDLADIKATQAEHGERLVEIERGSGLLLKHYGIKGSK